MALLKNNIVVLVLCFLVLNCSTFKKSYKERKTKYLTNKFELPVLNSNPTKSAEKLIKISEKLGFKKLTIEFITKGYLLEYSKDSLIYWVDIDTLFSEKLKLTFKKEKVFLKKISNSEFKVITKQIYNKIENEYKRN